tara:strand:- start:1429 stop:1710 length:282 start_codon:yes stop_codon:yes gene_type:complete
LSLLLSILKKDIIRIMGIIIYNISPTENLNNLKKIDINLNQLSYMKIYESFMLINEKLLILTVTINKRKTNVDIVDLLIIVIFDQQFLSQKLN